MAAPIITELAEKHGKPEDVIAQVLELMVEEGAVGLDTSGRLATLNVAVGNSGER